MNVSKYKRQLHALAAGILALLVYAVVFALTTGDSTTWSYFHRCDNAVGAIFCVLAGGLVVLIKLLTIGLPVAVTISAVYLKIVKFSTSSALLLPLLASIAVIALVVLVWQIADLSLPLWLIAGMVPLAYVALSFVKKKSV